MILRQLNCCLLCFVECEKNAISLSLEYVQRAPYNKHYTERQLEEGGGMILLDFNEEQVSLYSARLPSVLQELYSILFAVCACFMYVFCIISVKQPIRACWSLTSTVGPGSTCCVWQVEFPACLRCGWGIAARRRSCSTTGTTYFLPVWGQRNALWSGKSFSCFDMIHFLI